MNLTRGLEEAHNSMSQKILPLHWVHASKPIRAYKKGKSISAQLEQAMLKDLVAPHGATAAKSQASRKVCAAR